MVSAPLTLTQAWEGLRQGVADLDQHLAKSRIEVVPDSDWYLDGGRPNLQGAYRGWHERLDQVLAAGHAGLRVSGDVGWINKEAWDEFCDYEAQLDESMARKRMTVLCSYPLLSRPTEGAATIHDVPGFILDVVRTHRFAIVRRRGTWQLVETPQQRAAEADRARYGAQLEQMAQASSLLNSLASVNDVLRVAVEKAREIVGAHQAVIGLTKDESWAQYVHAISFSDKYAAARSFEAVPDGSGIYSIVCRSNRPARMTQAELEAHPAWRGFGAYAGEHPPLRGWLAAPLIQRNGKNLGLLQLSDKYEGEFTSTDEAVLVQLAQMVSVAIENAYLFAEVRNARERLHSLSHQLVEAQEDERRRIARELHDQVGQALTALKINLQTVQLATGDSTSALDESIAIAERTLQQVRDLSLDLRPSMLDDLGLFAALRWYLHRQAQRTGWTAQITGERFDEGLPAAIETVCFRVAQEALTNAARHAQARRVTVDLRRHGELRLSIHDDGVGFDVAAARRRAIEGNSLGLLGMQERVSLVGGRLDVDSTPGCGTQVSVSLPLACEPEAKAIREEPS